MRKLALTLTLLVFLSGLIVGSAVAEEEVKVPFDAVKSSCYGQIDMSKAEFPLPEIGKECVEEDWLEANLSTNKTQDVENNDVGSSTQEINWQVHSTDDISMGPEGQIKRFEYRVVIDDQVTPEEDRVAFRV